MIARIEEEEFADDEGLDQHDRTRRNDCRQTDDVHDSNDVENDVASAGQGFSEATHCDILKFELANDEEKRNSFMGVASCL